ncbi:hypothetical protein ESZ50_07940 [Weissella muntiaci]|uniref:DUF1492 domain-containing protein n=1 Tax=Weissella muntiaci TaxID=2508881 RepID=A0A6C2C573_9LACO|nr:hypothetical protein [Weissella muntiaci]TYC48799.1 hypothetical protein ESZ50_07940 [Weissella muntiaci]
MMTLPEIDEKETIATVRQYFDVRVSRLENIARTSIKSVTMDGVHSQHGVGSDDNGMVARVDAKDELRMVAELIENLGGNEAKFMKYRYIEKLTWNQIYEKSGYSSSRGYQIIQEAFVKFAERAGDEFGLVVYK